QKSPRKKTPARPLPPAAEAPVTKVDDGMDEEGEAEYAKEDDSNVDGDDMFDDEGKGENANVNDDEDDEDDDRDGDHSFKDMDDNDVMNADEDVELFDDRNPSFVATITPTYNHMLRLPADFARLARLDTKKILTLKSLDGYEEEIPLLVEQSEPARYYVGSGWKDILQSTSISEGDKCVFKFIASEDKPSVEVPQTLEYRGGQLNAALILEVENFTNWKKRFMCHIIGIEPQFENIIKNGPFIPMVAGQRKPEGQWTAYERKAANLDQRLKSLIMSVLPDDQMNSVINCLTPKSTWDDLILYHKGPFDVKESRVMDMKLCYNTFKFKECESLTQTFIRYKALMNELVNDGINLSKLEINTGFINGLPKKWLSFCQSLRNTNHVKDSELASLFRKLKYEENLIDNIYEIEKSKSFVSAILLSTAFFYASIFQDFQDSPDDEEDTRSSHEYLSDLEKEYQARALLAKSKRFFKKEEVSSDDNEVTKVKALMPLTNKERVSVSKESANNGEWVKISIQKCISKQISTQKKKILGIDQLTEDTSSSGLKDPVFVKSLADDSEVSITNSNKPKLSEAKDSTISNHDTGKKMNIQSVAPSSSTREAIWC
nr:retrovirus-related Pol polyprotein from transposon TNT 1-94 [Tanacetum cinerariifolium]